MVKTKNHTDESTVMKSSLKQIAQRYDGSRYVSHSEDCENKELLRGIVLTKLGLTQDILHHIFKLKFIQAFEVYNMHRKAKGLLGLDRDVVNANYIKGRLHNGMVLEGKRLDDDQVEAAVIDEDITLVHAAAGSGKTLTLTAKVQDLLDKGVQPSEILVLSFTRKTVNDLSKRFEAAHITEVAVKTFHSMGRVIFRDSREEKIKIADEGQSKRLVKQVLEELLQDDNYLRELNDYLLTYHTMPRPITLMRSEAESILSNKVYSRKPLKSYSLDKARLSANNKTYKGEFVRSKEEQIISNFLFINNISYKYEQLYPYGYPPYKPDFTLVDSAKPVYYEHFGISREGKAPEWFDNPHAYVRHMKNKRARHKKYGTYLLETYSYEWFDGSLLRNLEDRLLQADMKSRRMEELAIHNLIKKHYGYDIAGFMTIMHIFMTLFKNRYTNITDYEQRISELDDGYQKTRTLAFIELFKPIYDGYHNKLIENNLQDFADLLLGAAHKVNDGLTEGSHVYRYILVDEVQDISYARFELLKSLLDRSEGSKLFCVGDDFQSIYRFSGCDLSIMESMGEQLNRYVAETSLKGVYRFGNSAAQKTSKFIMANPNQYKKQIIAKGTTDTDIYLRPYLGNIDQSEESKKVIDVCKELIKKYGQEKFQKRGVLVLGRYTSDEETIDIIAERLDDHESNGKSFYSCNEIDGVEFKIEFCTVHQAKGREHDFVIVVGCNDAYRGFPSRITSDPLLETLLAKPDNFEYAEERRLFYVATTRALRATYLIGSSSNLSVFVKEMLPSNFKKNRFTCRVCGGKLVLRKSRNNFYGCENFIYGCNTTKKYAEEPSGDQSALVGNTQHPEGHSTYGLEVDNTAENKIYSKTGCGCYRYDDDGSWRLCSQHSSELGISEYPR